MRGVGERCRCTEEVSGFKFQVSGRGWFQVVVGSRSRTVEEGVGERCRCTMEMFKNLIVWQKAMELVRAVYALSKAFPADERYALTDQLRRAVVSIPSNIAEGNGRASNADYGHFLSIARGSLYETMTQLQIAVDLGYIPALDPTLEALISEVGRMLTSMLKKFGSLRCTPTPPAYT